MKSMQELLRNRPWMAVLFFLATVGVGLGAGLLLSSVAEHKAESRFAYTTDAKIAPDEARSDVWGQAYPLEYETWKATADTSFRSKWGGSATRDVLEEDPRMVVLWAGYAFSKHYNQSRGHAYAIKACTRSCAPEPPTTPTRVPSREPAGPARAPTSRA